MEGRCPPGTRIFWGASQRRQPQSRGGPEWPRRLRLSVVPGGHLPPSPARASHASKSNSLRWRNMGREVIGATWRVGLGGGALPGPVSSGELLNAGNHNLVAGPSGHADCGSAWSREGTSPSPARASHASKSNSLRWRHMGREVIGATWRVGLGEVPSRDPYLLGSFLTPATTVSWRARVATPIAVQRGPGRAPPPSPARASYATTTATPRATEQPWRGERRRQTWGRQASRG